ncbi:MAG: hypothetical protein NPIRA01_06690 [Nitrospirales bacterium]|nr:MAG: hypothetical protein NPIRA01_06690 [Nitrospirales bacterium]
MDMKKEEFNIVVVVWGKVYTEDFLSWTLPTHLSRRNLGVFYTNTAASCHYHIFTTTADKKEIEKSEVFSLLSRFATPEFHIIDQRISEMEAGDINKYDVLTLCHQEIVALSARQNSGLIVSGPEMLLADGAVENLLKLVKQKKKLVLTGAVRAKRESLLSDFGTRHDFQDDGSFTISPRDLVALSLKHVHPSSTSIYWNSPVYRKKACAYLYWPVGSVGLVQRGIHLHPFLSFPQSESDLTYSAEGLGIDGTDYALRVCQNLEQLHVVGDSDEVYYLTFDTVLPGTPPNGSARIIDLASWLTRHTHSHHRYFMSKAIIFHSTEINEMFDPVLRESENIVMQALRMAEAFEAAPDGHKEFQTLREVEMEQFRMANLRLVLTVANLYNQLGVEVFNGGKPEEAEKFWQTAIELTPSVLAPHDNLAAFYESRGNLKQAIQRGASGVYIDPVNPQRWIKLSQLYEHQGDYQRASECKQQAARLLSGSQSKE